ncbi:NCS2 family permease [Sporomusa acidovorans]|uniref:Adenine permease AdeQ n=1 Tax=Sporomusa acidovorans (strain ATCC 49682 / DSM 3132 / Mol) TaxID=1123286 RepID=A0ABZ3J579_SPOA4|nr:NCS2 family permease [Sporomusa acidovorans]OZC15673.1 adenine permease AdeQ [Sporomusa acidovorans DSM 3132]SDE88658.1 putative MFS transporter, AGZA family, xanthine/uracil permease [Sporomusa acidovorans]
MNQGLLDRLFKLTQKETDVKTELLAGLTTFVALAYIIFVNPNILADAGIPKEAAIASTIWATALATTLMAVWANFPIAVAPGMGLNAFFAYYVVGVLHLSWQVALGAVFCSGILFLILTLGGIRQAIIKSVPMNLKCAIGVGIGLFIAFIGLKNAGIIIADKATFVTLGHLITAEPLLACAGLIITAVFMARNVKGSILIGIITTTVLGMIFGAVPTPKGIDDIISFKLPDITPTFMQLDLAGAWQFGIFSIIFTFTIVELFDNMGTLIGLTRKAKLMDDKGEIENLDKALTTDAVGTLASAVFGTSTVTSYVESAAGIAEGGKTGLTALTIAALFIVSLFFAPLIGLVPGFATAPALILVGALMMAEIVHVDFSDFTDGFPAFMTIIMMPLTYSIANGFAFGFVSYTFVKVLSGRAKEVSLVMWLVSLAFLANFYMRLH